MITGKRLEIERLTSRLEGGRWKRAERHLAGGLPYLTSRLEEGRWKSTPMGNSLAAYPTSRTVLQRQGAG